MSTQLASQKLIQNPNEKDIATVYDDITALSKLTDSLPDRFALPETKLLAKRGGFKY